MTAPLWLNLGGPVADTTFAEFLAWPDRTEHVLVEADPSITLTGWTATGGSYPTTYQVSRPRLVQTTEVPGGLYAPVLGVTEEATALTSRPSIALVEANPGSWYWDEAAGVLYVHSTTGASPASFVHVEAIVRLYLGTAPVVLNRTASDPATGVYYHPWLRGDLPEIASMVEDLLHGTKIIPDGSVTFTNGHGAWHALIAPDGPWNWKNRTITCLVGGVFNGRTLTRAQYATMATMRVEDVAADEERCAFTLTPVTRATVRQVPVTSFDEATYPALGDGVRGAKKWIGYGRATMPPDLTDTTGHGVYTIADAASQTLFAVHQVWAIDKSTGEWTSLTEGLHYSVDLVACTLTILDAAYRWQDVRLAVDVTGKPDGSGGYLRTFAAIVQDLLVTFLGVATDAIDTEAFTAAAVEGAAEEIACWVKDPREIASLFTTSEPATPSLGRSVMGTVQQSSAGQWTCRLYTPAVPEALTALRKEDFTRFTPAPQFQTVYAGVQVYYNYDAVRGQWSVVEETDPATTYRTKSTDVLPIYTFLRSAGAARALAQRYLLLAGKVLTTAAFEERGARLAQHIAGDKVRVTFSPAPSAAGAYVDKPFEITELRLRFAPKLGVSGVLNDIRDLGGKVGRWMDAAAPNWASATDLERQSSGFWTDANGLADSGDPTSGGRSLWW
jgi:hypothetical protein